MALILLVDDDPQVRSVLKGFLQIGDHNVHEADDGHEAIKQVELLHPDLVISDIVMPQSDGFELIMSLAERPDSPGIIAITGGSANLNQQYLLSITRKMPVCQVLAKPVSYEMLLTAVEDALRTSQKHESP